MFESPLSVILSTVHQFYSLYHKVPVSNTSIQITKESYLYAYVTALIYQLQDEKYQYLHTLR